VFALRQAQGDKLLCVANLFFLPQRTKLFVQRLFRQFELRSRAAKLMNNIDIRLPSPDGSGYPFAAAFAGKDSSVQQETAPPFDSAQGDRKPKKKDKL
jgi:hypothetical protein